MHPRPSTTSRTRISQQRRLGKYYTPADVSSILAAWGIRKQTDTAFEPSFGGCGFLEAVRARLITLGNSEPYQNIYGCDIDHDAFVCLANTIEPRAIEGHFIQRDFLATRPSDFRQSKFDLVLGNPPYVSRHNMSKRQLAELARFRKANKFAPAGLVSLWAYFVLHSFQFLKIGGRIAWVLPGSLATANYGSTVRTSIANNFKQVLMVSLKERLFETAGASENSIILLAEGFGQGPAANGIQKTFATTKADLQDVITGWQQANPFSSSGSGSYSQSPLTTEETSALRELMNSSHGIRLNSIGTITIGTVTGANRFFILNSQQAALHNIDGRFLTPILASAKLFSGIALRKTDIRQIQQTSNCLLVDTSRPGAMSDKSVRKYLSRFPPTERERNSTFSRREHWHQANDLKTPDAFLAYMNALSPRIILNIAKVNSTNSLHRINFNSDVSRLSQRIACMSILSTPSQLSAEIEGRSYGSGLLKHEPSEAGSIWLAFPTELSRHEVAACYEKMDQFLRKRNFDAARKLADSFFFGPDAFDALEIADRGLNKIRTWRRKTPHD